MSQGDSPSVKLAERRPVVARLHLRHKKPAEIHQELVEKGHECDIRTVYRDIEALEAMWQKELIDDPVAKKAQELAEVEEAEGECWLQYAATKDRLWLSELRGWKERKAKLLGLDAPARQEVKADVAVEHIDHRQVLMDKINAIVARTAVDGGSVGSPENL